MTAGTIWQRQNETETARKYPMPGQLIDVGGHRLHSLRQGTGTPAVVMDAPATGASYGWTPIATEIAKFTEVITYDRAGFGWSDPGPLPRSAQQIVKELRALLQKAGAQPPYVLVGYSASGVFVRLYASQHPDEVAGLILLDAVNYDTAKTNFPFGQVPAWQRALAKGAFMGTGRLALPWILNSPRSPTNNIHLDMLSRTRSVAALVDEAAGQKDWLSDRAAMHHLGDMPVTVVSRRIEDTDSGFGQQWWLRGQRGLLTISRNTKSVIAQSDSHGFPATEPETVVREVREMVEKLRVSAGNESRPR